MGLPISQSLRAIERERGPAAYVLTGALVALMAGWVAWLVLGEVELRATSARARVEVDRQSYRVDAPLGGTIAQVAAVLGRHVDAGEVLFEIDSSLQRHRLDEERARLRAVESEIVSIRKVVDAFEAVIREDEEATGAAVREGHAREHATDSAAVQAEEEARRAGVLRDGGAIADIDYLRSRTEAEKQRAAADALGLSFERIRGEMRTRASSVRARVEELRKDLATLEGRKDTIAQSIATLQTDVELRSVRAPVAGTIGELGTLTPGAFVEQGARLCTVLPKGDLRVVAELDPREAAGRVRVGQRAVLRLDAYPWMDFGTVPARVTRGASEPRDGMIRVELAPDLDANTRITLEHGMTARTEITVERLSPARLAIRSIGGLFDGARADR